MESTSSNEMNYEIHHSAFIKLHNLQDAFIGSVLDDFKILHIYSVSKSLYILQENGTLQWQALHIINEYCKCSKDDNTLFCYDLYLNKQE
jgi:hypothetical protein